MHIDEPIYGLGKPLEMGIMEISFWARLEDEARSYGERTRDVTAKMFKRMDLL